jgi:hypothetical protein
MERHGGLVSSRREVPVGVEADNKWLRVVI